MSGLCCAGTHTICADRPPVGVATQILVPLSGSVSKAVKAGRCYSWIETVKISPASLNCLLLLPTGAVLINI